MMSLLSVTVKKARYVGAQASQFNTYVTLKLQNVKSTTVTVKGATPCWEQDFLFETNDVNTGLLIEVWSKGMIWDRAMGYHWVPLQTVQYANEEGCGQWLSLDAELVMRDGEVVGTKSATGHSLLVDCRFELPFDSDNAEAGDLQRKLEMLNNIMDQEARAEQARRQTQYFGHSGYSEDSDYTSDLNYPVGQHANSSASQFRSAAHQMHTPQRSLETSRENSYERDDVPAQHHLPPPYMQYQQHLSPGFYSTCRNSANQKFQRYSPTNVDDYEYSSTSILQNSQQTQDANLDSDPLFYNSRPPKYYKDYSSWNACNSNNYNKYNQEPEDGMDTDYIQDTYYCSGQSPNKPMGLRRPSLERQTTLYDDDSTTFGDNNSCTQISSFVQNRPSSRFNKTQEEYFDASCYSFHEERYGQDEEDRQWDSGGGGGCYNKTSYYNTKKLPTVPVVQNYLNKKRSSQITEETYRSCDDYTNNSSSIPKNRRKMPQIPNHRSISKQSSLNDQEELYDNYCNSEVSSHRGASLPPTPTKTPKVLARIAASLPPTPGRKLPQPNLNHRSAKANKRMHSIQRASSEEYPEDIIYENCYERPGAISAREIYNEDYNYAYQSIDNLSTPHQEHIGVSLDNNELLTTQNDGPLITQPTDDYFGVAQNGREYYHDSTKEPNVQTKKLRSTRTGHNSLESSRDDGSFDSSIIRHHQYYNSQLDASLAHTKTDLDTVIRRDQDKAIVALNSTNTTPAVPNVTITEPLNHTFSSRGYLTQQESIDSNYLQRQESINQEPACVSVQHPDPYLIHQESIESYVEEEQHTNDVSADYTKARESPASVIHITAAITQDDISLRRGSSQTTILDPFHPSLQQRPLEPYAPISTRRPSVDPYRACSPTRRASEDTNHSSSSLKPIDDSNMYNVQQRKNSVIDPYQQVGQRRPSVRHSPSPIDYEENEDEFPLEEEDRLEVEQPLEDEIVPPTRPQVTAQQRWLWAYNKIIMQLNVS